MLKAMLRAECMLLSVNRQSRGVRQLLEKANLSQIAAVVSVACSKPWAAVMSGYPAQQGLGNAYHQHTINTR